MRSLKSKILLVIYYKARKKNIFNIKNSLLQRHIVASLKQDVGKANLEKVPSFYVDCKRIRFLFFFFDKKVRSPYQALLVKKKET